MASKDGWRFTAVLRLANLSLLVPLLLLQSESALGQGCPDLGPNMELIQESDRYLKSTPDASPGMDERSSAAYGGFFRNDTMTFREIDYLTATLTDIDDLTYAKKKADDLEKQGQNQLANRIRLRIKFASAQLFGQPLTDQKLVCISVAEQLRSRAWACEKRGLYPMATKLYERVVSIYRKEIGNTHKTAGVLGDLGRAYAADRNIDKAKFAYNEAFQIYNRHPQDSDDEIASLLESYGDFLKSINSPQAAGIFKRAVKIRKASHVSTAMREYGQTTNSHMVQTNGKSGGLLPSICLAYRDQIQGRLYRRWHGWGSGLNPNKFPTFEFEINGDGTIAKPRVIQSSGVSYYDGMGLNAILTAGPFGKPPEAPLLVQCNLGPEIRVSFMTKEVKRLKAAIATAIAEYKYLLSPELLILSHRLAEFEGLPASNQTELIVEAIDHYAVSLKDKQKGARRQLYLALSFDGTYAPARQHLDENISRMGLNPLAFKDRVGLARQATGEGDLLAASTEYRESLRLLHAESPRQEDLIASIQKEFIKVEKLQIAAYTQVSQWTASLKNHPNSVQGHVSLARALQTLDRLSEARTEFKKALTLDSTSRDARQSLEQISARIHSLEEKEIQAK